MASDFDCNLMLANDLFMGGDLEQTNNALGVGPSKY